MIELVLQYLQCMIYDKLKLYHLYKISVFTYT